MSRSVSTGVILRAIMKKDLRLYERNKVYLLLTALAIAAFAAIFWIVPGTVKETITVAISPTIEEMIGEGREALLSLGIPAEHLSQLEQYQLFSEEEGLELVQLESEEQLKRVIKGELEVYRLPGGTLALRDPAKGDRRPAGAKQISLDVGLVFPKAFLAKVAMGEKTRVTIFADASVPEEIRNALRSLVRETAFAVAGKDLPVELPDEETVILGPDRVGQHASLRDKLRPLIAFIVLMVETYAMASLISTEVLQRTVTALIVTPMKVWHFLTAKTLFGTCLALGQGLIILLLVGAFTPVNWSLLLVTMLIASLLFTAVAMLIGAAGKDFLGQLMYALLFTIPLMIPAFSVLFPGTAATWVKAIPSYPIIHLLAGATIHQTGWADSYGTLIYASLWALVIYGLSLFVLRRKVETL